jgi:hypothetical protein
METNESNEKKSVINFIKPENVVLAGDTEVRILLTGGYLGIGGSSDKYRALELVERLKKFFSLNKIATNAQAINEALVVIDNDLTEYNKYFHSSHFHIVDDYTIRILLANSVCDIKVENNYNGIEKRLKQFRNFVEKHKIPCSNDGIDQLLEACPLTKAPEDI